VTANPSAAGAPWAGTGPLAPFGMIVVLTSCALWCAGCVPAEQAASLPTLPSGVAEPVSADEPANAGLPLGLTMGMTLIAAQNALLASGAQLDVHDDDKPVRGASVKLRARLPAGQGVDGATLYFVSDRLWRLKLRPGQEPCRGLEARLGAAHVVAHGCSFWDDPRRLRGALRCADLCQVIDTGVWDEVGASRLEAEEAYSGFHEEVERARRSSR